MAVEREPTEQAYLWRVGSRLARRGDYEVALPYLERSVAHIPTLPSYDATQWAVLGNAYAAMGKYKEAEMAYLKALSIQPGNSIAEKGLHEIEPRSE